MKIFLPIIILLVLLGVYLEYFYPPALLKRQTAAALENFGKTVEDQDRTKIAEALTQLITDDAKIKLDVNFYSIGHPEGKPVVEEFDKPGFIHFIDTVLYSLTEYHFTPELTDFALNAARDGAGVAFYSKSWADGLSYYGGVSVDMRFSADTTCTGQVVFIDKKPLLQHADCKVQMSMVPKPGQEAKTQNMDVMRQMLGER